MKTMPYLLLAATALVAGATSAANAADLLHFAVTGGYNAAFDLSADAMPDYHSSTSFDFNDVGGSFSGVSEAGTLTPATATTASKVQFYSASFGGGIGISANGLTRFVADSAQVYSGSTASPSFAPGVYALAPEYIYGPSVLTVSRITSPVPEPESWAMMVGGLGVVGGVVRRRRQSAAKIA